MPYSPALQAASSFGTTTVLEYLVMQTHYLRTLVAFRFLITMPMATKTLLSASLGPSRRLRTMVQAASRLLILSRPTFLAGLTQETGCSEDNRPRS
jgi:hypothetical protein